jgi:predicted nucleotidyltransferase
LPISPYRRRSRNSAHGLPAFPDHWRIASRAIELLAADDQVLGLYLSGSFANSKPDRWSDIDFYIIARRDSSIDELISDQNKLIRDVADIATLFPATHLGDPHQVIVFYRASEPIHVDYQYRKVDSLVPRPQDSNVMILLDRGGDLARWREACRLAPVVPSTTSEQLQYLENRFWGWCWYTHTKIERGELWEARDALEYLRSNVLVPLGHDEGQVLEGNRRLERKLAPEAQKLLASTIPERHNAGSYGQGLARTSAAYMALFDRAPANVRAGVTLVDRAYIIAAIAKKE